jgi:hypothetical protein
MSASEEVAKAVEEDQKAQVEETKEPSPQESQPETKKEESAPSQTEKTEEVAKSASDKEIPFHKHPRWIRTQNELKELREFKEKQSHQVQKEPEKPKEKASAVPPQYQKLFGDDVESYEAWRQFQREEVKREAESIYEERIRRSEEAKQQEELAQQKAAAYAEDQFLELAEETNIPFHDRNNTERNQILDICVKYGLFDANGLPNIKAANELRSALHPSKSDELTEEKKKVIAKTTGKQNASKSENKVLTPTDLKRMSISQFFPE